jgi:glucan 1,3-beta-glucosidase
MLFKILVTGITSRHRPISKVSCWTRTFTRYLPIQLSVPCASCSFHSIPPFLRQGLKMTDQQHIQAACAAGSTLSRSTHWIAVGEWSTAKTDCAFQNSRALTSRYAQIVGSCNGLSGKASTFSANYKTFLRQYWEAQVQTYEKAGNGWLMWTWKLENADDWSYQAGLANGWIPQKPTSYKYPNICG